MFLRVCTCVCVCWCARCVKVNYGEINPGILDSFFTVLSQVSFSFVLLSLGFHMLLSLAFSVIIWWLQYLKPDIHMSMHKQWHIHVHTHTHTHTRTRTHVFQKVLTPSVQCQEWGKCAEDDKSEFNQQLDRFNHTLQEAAMSLQGGIELRKPDANRAYLTVPWS